MNRNIGVKGIENIENILKVISYLKHKVDAYEIYYRQAYVNELYLENGKIDFSNSGSSSGIGIRAVIKKQVSEKRLGFAATTSSSYKNLVETADMAIKIAKANSYDKNFKRFQCPLKYKKRKNYSPTLLDITPEAMKEHILDINNELKDNFHGISISSLEYENTISSIYIANSEGIEASDDFANNSLSYELTTTRNNYIYAASEHHAETFILKPDVKQTAKRLLATINKQQPKTSRMQVLLHPDAFSDILSEVFVFAINGKNIGNNKSILKNKLNTSICNQKITIVDTANAKNLYCTRNFDDEGTPAKETVIVKDGILKNFIYDLYTATKENKESTGNAHRSAFTLPSIEENNFIVKPLGGKQKSLLGEIDKGIFVRDVMGTHTINRQTGDFSLGVVEGFYVENGEIKFPLRDTMMAGNFYRLMNNITSIGNKIQHAVAGNGGFYVPEVLFRDVYVIGE